MNVDKVVLYGGIVAMSVEELAVRAGECEVNIDSHLIPTLAMKLWHAQGKWNNGLPMDFLPLEKASDRVGLGHLPLIESVGRVEPCMPNHDDLEEQLVSFLRNVDPTNNVKQTRLEGLMVAGSFPVTATGSIHFMWPEYRGPIEGESSSSEPNNATGLLWFHYLA